eukprot:gene10511-biopygen16793
MGCIGLHWVAMGCNGLQWVAMGCIGLHWVAMGCIGLHWVALGCIGLQWVAMGCNGLQWVAMDPTAHFLAVGVHFLAVGAHLFGLAGWCALLGGWCAFFGGWCARFGGWCTFLLLLGAIALAFESIPLAPGRPSSRFGCHVVAMVPHKSSQQTARSSPGPLKGPGKRMPPAQQSAGRQPCGVTALQKTPKERQADPKNGMQVRNHGSLGPPRGGLRPPPTSTKYTWWRLVEVEPCSSHNDKKIQKTAVLRGIGHP